MALVGFPERADDAYNAAAVLADGRVQAIYRKVNLPNYGVFDELRYFQRGPGGAIIEVDGVKVGLTICEDIWVPGPPMTDEALAGARLVLNISASPYQAGKGRQREQMIAQRARDSLAAVAFCALVGGQDELVFDGHSFVVDHDGNVIARAPQFAEELLVCDVDVEAAGRRAPARHARAAGGARDGDRRWPTSGRSRPRAGSRPGGAGRPGRRAARRRRRDLRGARARHARLRDQERLRARRPRAVGRRSTPRWSPSSPSTPSAPSA